MTNKLKELEDSSKKKNEEMKSTKSNKSNLNKIKVQEKLVEEDEEEN